ncbi:transposase [Brevibacillus borstelensis]|uniref:helix-turn-helix domain-containing protein n=1 Tax=Brevibacillus borstelensis TaxID=45462 RepID=UPI0014901873|nr:helix-turn-helix domain-containing protein [Brevibacillus borstelensis]MCC0566463.1 transposase [Brevibacillus borstelensis]MCM3470980.1 transposase [Brevibacillus borstelensis]MCM3559948.1 transposase [Brevibacillus borstelensis]MCM3623109.1 transposase [Brevibacillus borstelensis]NOU58015.1 transposase [Brevibacillus borstelensis]
MPVKGQTFKNYSVEFKLQAVKMYLDQGMGYNRVTRELDLISSSYIRRWVKNYRELGIEGLRERRGRRKMTTEVALKLK